MKRTDWMKQSRLEIVTYIVVWGLLFAAPLLSFYLRSINDTNAVFDWMEVFLVWRKFAVYLLLFLIHNFLLAPLLVNGRKRLAYFAFVAVLIGSFTLYQCNNQPEKHFSHEPPEMREGNFPKPPEMPVRKTNQPPSRMHPPREHRPADAPPALVGERDILAIVVLLLMFGANLGIKIFSRSSEDRRRLAELEKQNLEQQLEYLRYQINPHFFMNTLNNIHALVDIDPAKAQETIVELSKMMRFVLYEGDKRGVPLTKEMEFIRTYVKLMQLRFTDKVRISLQLPAEVPDRTIPPLILISFVENAFKHGVSYRQESFIEVKVAIANDKLQFSCRNSKAHLSNEERGGVGLANVRKRLDLLYAYNYTLNINDDDEVYNVELSIPI